MLGITRTTAAVATAAALLAASGAGVANAATQHHNSRTSSPTARAASTGKSGPSGPRGARRAVTRGSLASSGCASAARSAGSQRPRSAASMSGPPTRGPVGWRRRRTTRRRGREPSVLQNRADAAAQLGQPDRLGDVVVGADLESQHGVRLAVECGKHDDRHVVAPRPQRSAHLIAVRPRPERNVQHDDVEAPGAGPVDRRQTIRDGHDMVALQREGALQRATQVRLVVDDQDAQRHVVRGARGLAGQGHAPPTLRPPPRPAMRRCAVIVM
jgi:hypothetical protein